MNERCRLVALTVAGDLVAIAASLALAFELHGLWRDTAWSLRPHRAPDLAPRPRRHPAHVRRRRPLQVRGLRLAAAAPDDALQGRRRRPRDRRHRRPSSCASPSSPTRASSSSPRSPSSSSSPRSCASALLDRLYRRAARRRARHGRHRALARERRARQPPQGAARLRPGDAARAARHARATATTPSPALLRALAERRAGAAPGVHRRGVASATRRPSTSSTRRASAAPRSTSSGRLARARSTRRACSSGSSSCP